MCIRDRRATARLTSNSDQSMTTSRTNKHSDDCLVPLADRLLLLGKILLKSIYSTSTSISLKSILNTSINTFKKSISNTFSSTSTLKVFKQEIWANAHETRDSISLIACAGCLGLSPVYFCENSLFKCASQHKIAKISLKTHIFGVQGRSRSSMLVPLESSSAVLVMICSKSGEQSVCAKTFHQLMERSLHRVDIPAAWVHYEVHKIVQNRLESSQFNPNKTCSYFAAQNNCAKLPSDPLISTFLSNLARPTNRWRYKHQKG